ncbi:hypothetical protein HPC50_12405 [Corallococcus exiguus]|uniref:hypothetical protein n=1 Tax=Corallococcus TaxID=83461 RepID=UPI0011C3EBF2|nr:MULTISPECIES: hypothetical protein [Corallococcus]NPC47875.1 hypothetical protein [Corallococcus exiguus]
MERTHPDLYDNKMTYFALSYVTDSLHEKGVASIGVGITFSEELVIRSPTAYELVRGSEDELVAGGGPSGLRWAGYYDPVDDLRMGGYLKPGMLMSATLTLNHVATTDAQGGFVYRFADGSEWNCTFDVN